MTSDLAQHFGKFGLRGTETSEFLRHGRRQEASRLQFSKIFGDKEILFIGNAAPFGEARTEFSGNPADRTSAVFRWCVRSVPVLFVTDC